MSEIEPSRDAELWRKLDPELEAFANLVPIVGPLTRWALQRFTRALQATEDHGVTIEQLATAMQTNSTLTALVYSALDATRRTRLDTKARAFGRAIANGYLANDDAEIDLEQMIVRTIDSLEAPHIAALLALEQFTGSATTGGTERFTRDVVHQSIPRDKTPATPIFQALNSLGLFDGRPEKRDEVQRNDSNALFTLSEYGTRILTYLRDAGAEE